MENRSRFSAPPHWVLRLIVTSDSGTVTTQSGIVGTDSGKRDHAPHERVMICIDEFGA